MAGIEWYHKRGLRGSHNSSGTDGAATAAVRPVGADVLGYRCANSNGFRPVSIGRMFRWNRGFRG
jgi:hypothetical protein